MKVLILGASGMIGRHAMQALRAAGCSVSGAGRHLPAGEEAHSWYTFDVATMTDEDAWVSVLTGFDTVINCVGIFREARRGDFTRLHRDMPMALFGACERLGLRRVIHLSALGSAPDAATAYWRSKGEAERDLLARRLSACIVRPSLVYGDEGPSSRLFRALATLPLLAMPLAYRARVQPLHVDDLAAGLVCLAMCHTVPRELAAVGPRALTMADYLGLLRDGMRAGPALLLALPMPLARLVAQVSQLHPASAFTPDALTMLAHSASGSNTADPAPLAALLDSPAREPANFTTPAQKPAAVLAWGEPLCRIAMALLWLITAVVSWFGWPHAQSGAWLGACGIPPAWQDSVVASASLLDGVIGLALLLRPRSWLWPIQIAAVAGYSVILSWCLPDFWLHPFGPLTKNLPILALMCVLWRLSARKH